MINEKIPLNLKSSVCVLMSGNEVAWVVGYRVDDRYKLTNNTQQVYQLDLKYDD